MNNMNRFLTIEQGGNVYTFLPTGDLFTIKHNNLLANQFRGNAKDGSANNIWLRVYHGDKIISYPLLGIRSGSRISAGENGICFTGTIEDIEYKVSFRPVDNMWIWEVHLEGSVDIYDLIYGQDLGVGDENGVYTNELYMSQYLGHSIFYGDNGYVVCSRQNMPSGNAFPYMQQGALGTKIEHFSTDGLQFFGLSYKETGEPEALMGNLKNENLQYEFAYTALQTEKMTLDGSKTLAFYGYFQQDYKGAVVKPISQEVFQSAYHRLPEMIVVPVKEVRVKKEFGDPISSLDYTEEELEHIYPVKKLIERLDGRIQSFFTGDHAHVVLKEKEMAVERPHGTIIITPPDERRVHNNLIASTHYMYGIFNSHVVIGNTDMHKMLSTPRGFLNIMKNSGQRIYVRIHGCYHLLNMPGLYEMGMNYSKWFYKLVEDTIIITAYTAAENPDLILHVSSKSGNPYDYIITNQLTMGAQEYERDILCAPINQGLCFNNTSSVYPDQHYNLIIPDHEFIVGNDGVFYMDNIGFDETFLTLALTDVSDFKVIIEGYLTLPDRAETTDYEFEIEKQKCLVYYEGLTNHFSINSSAAGESENGDLKMNHDISWNQERIDILNETIWWYAHNAMIHYSMPHGLEQPGGAAWGTRDICQGPIEFFLTTQHYDLVRNILMNVFAHQSYKTREWHQWFMFDKYSMNAGECHGDVVLWPLKCTADYINATGDNSILSERIPYDDWEERETLLSHISLALSNIKETRLVKETGLITYAGGDWDDTLQPADPKQKEHLISTWTVALAYQTFSSLSEALDGVDNKLSEEFKTLSLLVKAAFDKYLIKDEIPAGFMECGEGYQYMLHPRDTKTGIHYRLLPLTRSIIAELVTKEQAVKNRKIILEHLKCPDGVRLMDKPAAYEGGISRLFKRAEQSANVGREVSLQYTHAHIRYIEAMAKIGDSDEVWNGLFTVNPILIQKTVPNAALRQSNLYFTSSEGAFHDRYEYAKDFNLLRTGDIKVKGGWRLYSSGPGIYIRQIIESFLGIRFTKEGMIVDPMLPKTLDGTVFQYNCFGRILSFVYHHCSDRRLRIRSGGSEVAAKSCDNPYRPGGLLITKEILYTCNDILEIFIPISYN